MAEHCGAGGVDGTNSAVVPQPLCGANEALSSSNQGRGKKLVLHIDLNNTILVSDAAQGQRTVDALDFYLTTVTWGKMNEHGKWEWLSDSPSLLPPREDAVSFHSQFGETSGFTTGEGRRFRAVLDQHLDLLRWPEGAKGDRELAIKGEDGRLYHWILPSFFQLLRDLTREGREFAVLFRTFGVDLPRVLRAVSRALDEGAHPLFPDLPELKLSLNMTPGEIDCSNSGIFLRRGKDRLSTRDGERGLYQFFSSVQGLGGFVDDYNWWVSNDGSIRGGKPLWVDPFDQSVQHIFIDDNLRPNDEDTVVLPKVFLEPAGAETRTASISELYDITLVHNDLLRAISDPSYFTHRVHACLENYDRTFAKEFCQMKRMSQRSTIPGCGVTFEIVSNIPGDIHGPEDREMLARLAASTENDQSADSEAAIEKYLRSVLAVLNILTLDRLRHVREMESFVITPEMYPPP